MQKDVKDTASPHALRCGLAPGRWLRLTALSGASSSMENPCVFRRFLAGATCFTYVSSMSRLTRSEWTLLVLASAPRAQASKIQLQKSLFLIGKYLPDVVGDDFFSFEAYDYGPFTKEVYRAAEELIADQLALPSGNDFFASASGRSAAESLQVDASIRKTVARITEWVSTRSFQDLCEDVYEAFPEMRARSVMRILPKPTTPVQCSSLVDWFDALPPQEHKRIAEIAEVGRKSEGDPKREQRLTAKN